MFLRSYPSSRNPLRGTKFQCSKDLSEICHGRNILSKICRGRNIKTLYIVVSIVFTYKMLCKIIDLYTQIWYNGIVEMGLFEIPKI